MTEVREIHVTTIGGAPALLVDYGAGPGLLCDDGVIRFTGEVWLRERSKPSRMGRYRMHVNPWRPNL